MSRRQAHSGWCSSRGVRERARGGSLTPGKPAAMRAAAWQVEHTTLFGFACFSPLIPVRSAGGGSAHPSPTRGEGLTPAKSGPSPLVGGGRAETAPPFLPSSWRSQLHRVRQSRRGEGVRRRAIAAILAKVSYRQP